MLSPCTHPTGREVIESPGLPVIPGTGGISPKDLGIVIANMDITPLYMYKYNSGRVTHFRINCWSTP